MELSILIPSRNEIFLKDTIEDILKNIEADTEVIALLDGKWADPAIPQHPRVNVIYVPEALGQREGTNVACRLSKARFVMKVDAHCSFDKGFDRKMIEAFKQVGDDVTMVPTMRNLHAFDWKCYNCGWKKYQGPTPTKCDNCDKPKFRRKMLWIGKVRPQSNSYSFDAEPHFQYNNEFTKRPGYSMGIIVGYDLFLDKPSLTPSVISLLADLANSHQLTRGRNCFWWRQDMASDAVSFPSVDGGGGIRTSKINRIGDELEVNGITTGSVFTEMVKNGDPPTSASGQRGNQPSIGDAVSECFLSEMGTPSISGSIKSPLPIPTTGDTINSDVLNKLIDVLGGQFVYNEKTSSFHNGSVALTPRYDKDLTETMSLQGSCFMATRENYWAKELCDEFLGNWGNQGIEVACATWLTGGRVLVNHNTWYAHMFRTQGGDFGFPWPAGGRDTQKTKDNVKDKFWNNKHPKQIHSVEWLVKKFWPVSGWNEENLNKLSGHN